MGQPLRIVTELRGKTIADPKEAERIRIEASYGLKAGRIIDAQAWAEEREKYRPLETPDRPSVQKAMLAVEGRIVEAVWTLARLPGGGSAKGSCGIAYIQDSADRWANAVEKGWEAPMPKPSRPSPRSIDAMYEPLEWLSLLPRPQAMLVSVAAGTKCGNVDRRVAWNRVRKSLLEAQTQSIRTLQRRYESGIREIVARLTEKAMHEKI